MVILLKTASVRVSSIQIMQVRVQNKGKSVWKSRYDGDVSIRRGADDEESPRQNLHRRRKLGPEADSIEYGYRVPFGGIHVFIGKIGEPGPEPDLCTDLIKTAQRARPARTLPALKHVFVGFVHGAELEGGSESGGEMVVYSGYESSTSETNSIYQVTCMKEL